MYCVCIYVACTSCLQGSTWGHFWPCTPTSLLRPSHTPEPESPMMAEPDFPLDAVTHNNNLVYKAPSIQMTHAHTTGKLRQCLRTCLNSLSASYSQAFFSFSLSWAKAIICSNDALSSLVFFDRKRSRQGSSFSSFPLSLPPNEQSRAVGHHAPPKCGTLK